MYRQIMVHPEDRNLQRIVWRSTKNDTIHSYRLNTVTYGLACAPFLAVRTLRQLASDEEGRFPQGAAVRFSMGYHRKTDHYPTYARGDQAKAMRYLGLQWYPDNDTFAFSVQPLEELPVTKRSVLSQAARLFDPLGWLAPIVVRVKILIQSTWLQGLDWDTPLSPVDTMNWRQLQEELQQVADIRVHRWLHCDSATAGIEVHGFADASERAYAAVVYLRAEENQEGHVSLVMAKSKVAPIKQVSLPRLELCAAELLVRLTSHVLSVLELRGTPVHFWSDSTVTLSWIRGHPSRWKTYVANRVSKIQTTLPEAHWHHVISKENPADCASRGLSPRELANHALWWSGPEWLASNPELWRASNRTMEIDEEDLPEKRMRVHAGAVLPLPEENPLLSRYSSLTRLLRISAWCRRWLRLRSCNSIVNPTSQTPASDELDGSLRAWIRVAQTAHYHQEIADVREGKSVSKKSKLHKLTSFLDNEGILRVGGRIKHSLLAFDERHPIILPSDSRLTTLIVDSCHTKTLHGGAQQTLGLVRQRFWVPRGRAVVRKQIHRCIRCRRWRAVTPQPMMADFPSQRVTPTRPFLHSGVDYAGSTLLRTSKGRGHKATKAFIAIFVCMSTRAVHIEVVSDYSSEAFLAALRFIARRGRCQVIYSDCGTNFAGADAAFRAMFAASCREARKIHDTLANDHIQWRFNPPAAPHFGGLWEAAVKAVKHHLRRVIGESKLTSEEMTTLLTQIEACLNSRPFQPLTDDPEDVAALTPGHFLVGSALTSIPEPSLEELSMNRLTRWQLVQQMRDHFWNRWAQEYLRSLTPRPKWASDQASPGVGQLCLVRHEMTPPARWPLGRIVALNPGDDGRTRVVTIKTATTELTRPVCKVVPLPIHSATEEAND